MHALLRGASTQEIDPGSAEFPGARSGEDELQVALFLDEQVDHLQQFGDLLNFIDQHVPGGGLPFNPFPQPLRTGR